jgi:hypothetical protein
VTPNKPMQRAGTHKLLGRGRDGLVIARIYIARVLNRRCAVADGWRYAAGSGTANFGNALSNLPSMVTSFTLICVASAMNS